MPKHLEELVLSKEARDMIINLDLWLAKNEQYKLVDSMNSLDECVSEGLEQEIIPLGDEVARRIATVRITTKTLIPCTYNIIGNTTDTKAHRPSKTKRSRSMDNRRA